MNSDDSERKDVPAAASRGPTMRNGANSLDTVLQQLHRELRVSMDPPGGDVVVIVRDAASGAVVRRLSMPILRLAFEQEAEAGA